jgi:hypothetical protein
VVQVLQVAAVLVVQDFVQQLQAQEFSTLVVAAVALIQPHKILVVLVAVGLVLVVQALEPQVHPIQVVAVAALQDRVQQVAQAVLALSSFVIPHLYYHPLPQQEALR